jgi:hypothetical protein
MTFVLLSPYSYSEYREYLGTLHSLVRGSAIRMYRSRWHAYISTAIPQDEEACPHELVDTSMEGGRCPQAKLVASFKHAGDSLEAALILLRRYGDEAVYFHLLRLAIARSSRMPGC